MSTARPAANMDEEAPRTESSPPLPIVDAEIGSPSGIDEFGRFDFEEAICRDAAERDQLLKSQGPAASAANQAADNDGLSNSGSQYPISLARGRTIVCRHWMRGMCWKGDFCEFLHEYDTGRMPLCRQYQKKGYCADLERGCCMFVHGTRPPDHAPICIHYFLGFCRAGPRCRKKHQRLGVEARPALVPDWYLHLVLANAKVLLPEENSPETDAILADVEEACRRLAAESAGGIFPTSTAEDTLQRSRPADAQHSSARTQSELSTTHLKTTGNVEENRTLQPWREPFNKSLNPSESTRHHGETVQRSGRSRGVLRQESVARGSSVTGPVLDPDFIRVAQSAGIPRLSPGPRELSSGVQAGAKGSEATLQHSKNTQIFMIKSNDLANIRTSIRLGVWATGKQNTRILDQAFRQNKHVVLLFSANESGGFQGYARMATPPIPGLHPNLWGTFSTRLGGNFRIQWLKQCRVDFEKFGGLTNPLNDNQPIRKSRDGQEVPLSLASIICSILHEEEDVDLLKGTPEEHKQRIDHDTFFQLSETAQIEKELALGLIESPPPSLLHSLLGKKDNKLPTMNRMSTVAPRPPPPPPPPPVAVVPRQFNEELTGLKEHKRVRPSHVLLPRTLPGPYTGPFAAHSLLRGPLWHCYDEGFSRATRSAPTVRDAYNAPGYASLTSIRISELHSRGVPQDSPIIPTHSCATSIAHSGSHSRSAAAMTCNPLETALRYAQPTYTSSATISTPFAARAAQRRTVPYPEATLHWGAPAPGPSVPASFTKNKPHRLSAPEPYRYYSEWEDQNTTDHTSTNSRYCNVLDLDTDSLPDPPL